MAWFASCGRRWCWEPVVLVGLLVFSWACERCEGFGTFEFDIHHRFSDPVAGILPIDGLPSLDSLDYYRLMTHRDRLIRGRRLAAGDNQTLVTFADGNETLRVDTLGFLHYANVTVGTPAEWYLVALDTGSDLFWLPCDCTDCLRGLKASDGSRLELNIYSPNASSTSAKVPCNSTLCLRGDRCPSPLSNCPYQVQYLSNGTSSTGFLVEDVLHLVTNEDKSKAVDAHITLGCGKAQTGVFHDGAAPNGLFGLGIEEISVPSTLAKAGIAANSFSMCFGKDSTGRISFGDKGSPAQRETPINIRQQHPTYNISITQLSVGGNTADLEFSAVFDSGTSFTYLSEPAYTLISESFNSLALDKRFSPDSSELPFEYCYIISSKQGSFQYPAVNLTMKGGGSYPIYHPLVVISSKDADFYCLGIVKSEDVSIIGQNFMTGYRVVFDREKSVLGWIESDCYGAGGPSTSAVNRPSPSAKPPDSSVNPEATNIPSQRTNSSSSSRPASLALSLLMILPILALL